MILSILKIIGIIILVLLAILLLILLEVLFIPIRYEFEGSYMEKADGDIKVTWFPVLLKAIVSFHDGKLIYIIKAFGGVIMTNTDAKLSFLGRKLFSEERDEAVSREDQKEMPVSAKTDDDILKESPRLESVKVEENKTETILPKEKRVKKPSVTEKIKDKWKDILHKIKRMVDNLKKMNEKKEDLLKVYHSKRFEKAKKDVILYVKQLFRIIKPDKLEGRVHFGLNDPAATGEIFGILAMFLPLYDGYFVLVPEFEYACTEGNIKGKGKVQIFPILMLGLKIIFNKNLIKVTKKVQTIIER